MERLSQGEAGRPGGVVPATRKAWLKVAACQRGTEGKGVVDSRACLVGGSRSGESGSRFECGD